MNPNKLSERSERSERRSHPRLITALPLRIKTAEFDITTSTRDISCVGAYCQIDKYLPPMTKLDIAMVLNNQPAGVRVKCKGVVVRSEPNENKFNIAIFFNDIAETEKEKISKFIKNLLNV